MKLLTEYGPRCEKICLPGFAINKGANQPVILGSLNSTFVIRFLESNISKLATGEISIFHLVSVAKETGLSLTLSETGRQCLPRRGPYNIRQVASLLAHLYHNRC